jgi:hypothetical protein
MRKALKNDSVQKPFAYLDPQNLLDEPKWNPWGDIFEDIVPEDNFDRPALREEKVPIVNPVEEVNTYKLV